MNPSRATRPSLLLILFVGVFVNPVDSKTGVRIAVSDTSIGMGRTLSVTATVEAPGEASRAGYRVNPYVNGKRWGAEEITNQQGQAVMLLPLPNPGPAEIQVVLKDPPPDPMKHLAKWIWARETADHQTVYFLRSFNVAGEIRSATLRATCDDAFKAFLNGQELVSASGFQKVVLLTDLAAKLRQGENTLLVEGTNGGGPAGLVLDLEVVTSQGAQKILSDGSWMVSTVQPSGWPSETGGMKDPAFVICPLGDGVWSSYNLEWPGYPVKEIFPAGKPIPDGANLSNKVTVQVTPRAIIAPPKRDRLVAIEWEPWFTPLNCGWQTAQGQPIVGYYDSYNLDVIHQHCIWMVEAGINLLIVDWTNNLWDKKHWSERGPHVDELVKATEVTLEAYYNLAREGIPVPKLILLPGLCNGPKTTMTAINEQQRFVYDSWVKPGRYKDLWFEYEGKPLIITFNGAGPGLLKEEEPADESQWTIRYMTSQLQMFNLGRQGYWSWMDGSIDPVPTINSKGEVEALTVTPAFFSEGGWLAPKARGRMGGSTFAGTFRQALKTPPRFLVINQWNEFAGQPDGSGYGPNRDVYLDCYNIPFSNDIEPTSLTSPAYRNENGGYGYFYLNLMRALIDLYRQGTPTSTVLTIANPDYRDGTCGDTLEVRWTWIGKQPETYSLYLDGHLLEKGLQETFYTLGLGHLKPGEHTLKVVGTGTETRWLLSKVREDLPLEKPVEAFAETVFLVGEN